MAKYSKEQYDQFIQDNLEVAELAQQAGIELSQLPEGALKFDALEPSWGQTLSAGVSIAGQNIKKQGLGLARSFIEEAAEPDQEKPVLERALSNDVGGSIVDSAKTLARYWMGKDSLDETAASLKQADAEATQQIQETRPYLPDDYSAKSLAVDAVGGLLPSLGTGLVVGAATRNPMLAGAAAGASEYGGYYGDSRDQKNLTPEEARGRARDLTLMSGATSALPMAGAIGKLGGGLMARIGGTALSEGAQESAMTLGEAGYDAAVYDEALPQDLLAQTGRGFLVGALGGATMGSVGLGIRPESEVNPDPNPNVESQPETEMNTEAVDLNTPTYEREGVNLGQQVNVTEQPQPIVNESIVNEQPTDVDPVQALLTEPEVSDAEPVEQAPIDDAPEVDSQQVVTDEERQQAAENSYRSALKDFSEIGNKKNKSRQKDLILAANKYLGTPKNPPKKGGKKALLKRISETAKAIESLDGETAETLKVRFPSNKDLIAFRKKHGIKSKATNKETMIKSILDWRDKPHGKAMNRIDKNVLRNKVTQQYKNKEPIALSDFRQVRGSDYSLHQYGDVVLSEAKGLKEIPPLDKQDEDYKLVHDTSEILEDTSNDIIDKLSDKRMQHYVDRFERVTNYDVRYLDTIKVMQDLGYSKEVSRALGKMNHMDIAEAIVERAKQRGLNVPQHFYDELYDDNGNLIDPQPTDEQKQSDTDKPKAEKPQKYEAKDKTFYTNTNTSLDEVAAKYDDQEELEQAAFEAGKSNPNKFSPKVLQETGFNHAVDIDSAGFDGDKVLAKVEEGQKAGGAKGLVGSTPHKYSAMGTSLDEVAAKYKDQEAIEKAAFEAGKANPDKNLMTAFGDTGFYSLRDVEIAGFDPRKVSDAVKKGQEAAAKDSDKPKSVEGKAHDVYTPDNEKVETKIKVVDASELQASHSIEGATNPNYPQELQPRNRNNSSLVAKTKKLAKTLNPKRLDISNDIVTGAPIVKDNIVESGNGRTIAITESYRTDKGQEYKQYLIDNADKYGIDPKDIEAMDRPVLVLERQGDMTAKQRQEFTKKANRDVGASMTPLEQAKSDSELLTYDDLLEINIGDTGDMNAASNNKFLSRFSLRLGDEATAQYVGRDNRWNSDMGKRALAAVFQKAYGDDALTTNVFEDSNQDTKRVMSALARASGHIAKLKGSKGGDHGLGEAIAEAANVVRAAGNKGQSAKEYLTQLDMLDQPSPVALDIAQLFAENATSAKRMGDVLVSLSKQIENENQKAQSGSLFGDSTTPKLSELTQANKDYQNARKQTETSGGQTGDLFGTNAPKLPNASNQSGGRSKPSAEQRTETQTTEGVETPLTPPSKMSIARIGEIATANDRLGRIKQLIKKGYSREDAIKLNNKLEVQRKRELEHKRGQGAINRKPEPTLEPLAEQDKSPALDDVIIQLSGKSSPAYLAARKLAHNIKNRMVEGVSFNDAYNHYRKLNSSGISTFDRTYKALTGRTPTQALLDPRKEKNLDQIKTVGDAIFNIKSGRDMVHWLSKHATSPVNRRIAERIAPLISADLKIKSIGYRKGNKPPAGMGNKQGWYLYDRFESGKVDERILLWNEGEKRASTEEVVTHELIHAATSLAIANAKKADPKSEIAKVVKELDAIRKEAFEHYVNRKAKRQLTATEKSKEGKFAISKGLNNTNSESAIDEFVAWGLTNPELQDILKGIKLKPKKSAWSEFVNAIGKLLGLKPTDNTALGRLLETTDKLLTLSEAEQVAESRSLGADARNANGDFTQERVNELRTKIDPKSDRVPLHKDIVNKAKALQQQGFGNVTSNVLSMLRKGIADKYEPLKKLDEELFGDNVLHDITSRAWVLAKTANSAQGALQAMLSFGRIRYNANQKLIETVHDKNDGGLMAVLEQLNEKHELADFFTWIAANRANDINERSKAAKAEIRSIKAEKKLLKQMRHEADSKRTRNQIEKAITDADSKIKELKKMADVQERFLTEEDIEVGLTLNQLERSDGTSREALFDKVFKEFNQYRGDILKIAEQNGIITSENREMWTDQFYVPFYRVLGDSDQVGMYPSAGLSRQDVIKKLKGSEKDLGDLMENALLNFHYLLNASLKNRAAMQALENGELAGIARQVQEHKIKDKDKATYVMIDGKKQWYEVDDPVFLSALMSMGNTKLPKGLQEIANVGSGAKVLLTKYTTGAPTFIVANFVRDMFLSPAMAKVGWKKGGTFHGARLWGVGEMNKVQADMLAAGGAFEFGFNRDEVKGDVDKSIQAKITQPQDAMRILGKPLYYGKKAVRGYGQVQGIAENANRAAIYDANLDKGKLYAAFEAMDLMDFGAGGSWAAVRLLNSLVPFLNATIQGVDKTARQMGTVSKAVRGKASLETAAQAKRFALYAGSLATASVALALQNADDEEYQELPEYAKNTNWFVRIGGEKGEYMLIPKPYSIGFMINTAERVTDSFTGAIKATDTLDYVKQTLFDTFTFNPTPQIAKPIMELYMNKNMFTGRAIETSSDRRYSKAERADYRTSEVAKMLGNDYLSPKQIDHLIKGYFSTIGDIVLNGTNIAENERPTKHWYEGSVIPARVFYKDLSSPSFTKSQQRFYDIYTEYSQAKADYKRAVEMGGKVKAKEILTEGRVNIALLPMMDKYKRKLTDVNNRIDAVRNTKSLSADEKRSYIDAYNRLKAETYSTVIDQVDRVLERVKNNN